MNQQQLSFSESQSFHVSHVAEDCEVSNIPVLHSSEDVKRIVKESARARLISQVVAAPDDYLERDFAAAFQTATRDTDPPQFATSHKTRTVPRRHTIPTYPSVVQSLRWNPYVEMSSPENSHTDLVEENPKYNCRCENCSAKNCPSRVISSETVKHGIFKDNIMTFSDQYTMTPRINDACCGVCIPIPTTPKVSNVCVPPDVAVRNTETLTNFPNMYTHQSCTPIPIFKKSDFVQHPTGHVSTGIRQEAVRDTDIGEGYCEPIKPKSFKNFFKFKKKQPPAAANSTQQQEYSRMILYNEGISDNVATTLSVPPIRMPSPILVNKRSSSIKSVRSKTSKTRCHFQDAEDGIPYTHRPESRYHHSCKKPNLRAASQSSDVDVVRYVVESPPIVRKTFASRPVKTYKTSTISLPRKVLTSELNIDSYIAKGRQETNAEPSLGLRKKQ